ncbi:MAG TPA: elongation factor P maturation arginine rhamnosyltransferase EarP [Alphaproteobacteria bacterium]|nr:elongation factor P maturation arginine rhamnosyltransferase EarP [Alphaproteobacteria bacterium]HNS45113.1 elongation factor P maturation arginine rhamnosyltransferase EarP [Alphaproteobacteria bacterium]
MMSDFPASVDIFCKVIDHYGDAGVCWRLARQMAVDDGKKVRLFIDDVETLRRIVPEPDKRVEIVRWGRDLVYGGAADLVIEAFACDLPDQVLEVMGRQPEAPVWVDLEYLTAEEWPLSCHAVPSVHPSTGLKKTLFFPGFDVKTGGLIRENDLIARRNVFQGDVTVQNQWRLDHKLPEIDKNCLDLSLFSYKTAPIEAFFKEISGLERPVRVFYPVPDGFGVEKRGNLTIYRIPFVKQEDYDYLLWTCDANFVRGEDSFVRAQYAGRPMIWNIYVQEDEAHFTKLDAFLTLYRAAFSQESREGLAKCFEVWNQRGQDLEGVWLDFLKSLPELDAGAKEWADRLCSETSLTERLYAFCREIKS